MSCEEYKDLMMGYLDDELGTEEREAFEKHLAECAECASELREFKELKSVTDTMEMTEPEDRLWADYWSGIYNRIERRIGWIVFSAAAMLLIIYGGFKIIEEVIRDPKVGLLLKIGLVGLIIGLAILLVSVARERIYFWKRDRYRNVRR